MRRLIALTATALALSVLLLLVAWYSMLRMPGESLHGPLPPLTAAQSSISAQLRATVTQLSVVIGERNVDDNPRLQAAANWLDAALRQAGYEPIREAFKAYGEVCENLEVELKGRTHPRDIVLIGAHYDSVSETVGADDNASGAAALLVLAQQLRGASPERTLRFVWFTNEEPPHFQAPSMGSLHYARRAAQRGDVIVAMLSLETIGYYTDAPNTQAYPAPLQAFYPSTGNFIAFVGNVASRDLVRRALGAFRHAARFPSEGAALPGGLPGIGWSDHWSFWQAGYPAIMVTDTAPFRYPHYHTREDTVDKLDYPRMARVTEGLRSVVLDLVGSTAR